MRFNLKRKEEEINRGDIVEYIGSTCLVAEDKTDTNIYLVSLTTGLVVKEFTYICELRRDENVTLIAKHSEIELRLVEEVPF